MTDHDLSIMFSIGCHVQGRGRGPPGRGAPAQRGGRMGASPAGKEDRRNAKAMAKLDKQVQAEKPRVYKSLGAEDSQEAARSAALCCLRHSSSLGNCASS